MMPKSIAVLPGEVPMKSIFIIPLLILLLIPNRDFAGEYKHLIALCDLTGEGMDSLEAKTISDRLWSELVNSQQFRVMEHGEMESILKKQRFQQNGACADQACFVKMGKILGVKRIIAGTVINMDNTYTISSWVINVTTDEIEFSVTADCKCRISELLTETVPSIAQQIATKFNAISPPSATPAPKSRGQKQPAAAEKKKPFVAQWYFWVPAAAAVVGGGAAYGYLWLKRRNNGTNSPEQPSEPGGVLVEW
jgi:hypothetical protein